MSAAGASGATIATRAVAVGSDGKRVSSFGLPSAPSSGVMTPVPTIPGISFPPGLGRSISTRRVRFVGSIAPDIRDTVPLSSWPFSASRRTTAGAPTFNRTASFSGTFTTKRTESTRATTKSGFSRPPMGGPTKSPGFTERRVTTPSKGACSRV